jgi:hypothetical protein
VGYQRQPTARRRHAGLALPREGHHCHRAHRSDPHPRPHRPFSADTDSSASGALALAARLDTTVHRHPCPTSNTLTLHDRPHKAPRRNQTWKHWVDQRIPHARTRTNDQERSEQRIKITIDGPRWIEAKLTSSSAKWGPPPTSYDSGRTIDLGEPPTPDEKPLPAAGNGASNWIQGKLTRPDQLGLGRPSDTMGPSSWTDSAREDSPPLTTSQHSAKHKNIFIGYQSIR